MGLFGENDDSQAQREIQARDEEIAELRRELAAKSNSTSKVTVDDVDVTSMEVRQVPVSYTHLTLPTIYTV